MIQKQIKNNSEVDVTGYRVSNLNSDELLNSICNIIKKKVREPALVLSANIHACNQAHKNEWLMEMNSRAELVRNDSHGIMLASTILGTPLKARMTWADFGWDLARFCEKEGLTLFFLGNELGIAEKAKSKLQEKCPELKVLGTYHGFFDKEGRENEQVVDTINDKEPDILIVGFGMPLQEKWVKNNRNNLNVGVIMTGGNCFTFLAGAEQRAPKWMHKNGFEWLFRFIKEPIRMFNRYIIGNPVFFFRVIKQRLLK